MIHIFGKKDKILFGDKRLQSNPTSGLGSLGVEIEGIQDITMLKDNQINKIKGIINKSHLLVIRGNRNWTIKEQIAFTKKIGEFEGDETFDISPNKLFNNCNKENGIKQLGMYWHSDNAHQQNPSHISVLQMTEIPSVGTQTFFTSLAACYKDLSSAIKEQLKFYDAIYGDNNIPHPLIWKHPFNGQSVLYFDVGEVHKIVTKDRKDKLSLETTNAIICELNKTMNHQIINYKHQWKKGDLLLIDNYAVAHRTNLLFKSYKQTMFCTTTKGIYF